LGENGHELGRHLALSHAKTHWVGKRPDQDFAEFGNRLGSWKFWVELAIKWLILKYKNEQSKPFVMMG